MIDFLIEGGYQFTFTMTFIFLINILLIARSAAYLFTGKYAGDPSSKVWIDSIKYIAVFLLTTGILGQIIGLHSAFSTISTNDIDISPQMLFAGLKVSSITTILGLSYFVVCYAAWFFLNLKWNTVNAKQ